MPLVSYCLFFAHVCLQVSSPFFKHALSSLLLPLNITERLENVPDEKSDVADVFISRHSDPSALIQQR